MADGSAVVWFGIPVMALTCGALFVWAQAMVARKEGRPVGRVVVVNASAAAGWLALALAVASSGALAQFDRRPPPFVLLLGCILVVAISVSTSSVGRKLADTVPVGALVLAQSFRLPLELVMHQAALEGVMPVEMSFQGYNFDIVTGALAIPVGLYALRNRKGLTAVVLAWLVLAWVTLVTVVGIAMAASPVVHFFGTEPAHLNTWVAHAPYVWLPTGAVLFALSAQIILVRKLLKEHRRSAAVALQA